MAREKFEDRRLTGPINVACKYEDGSVRYWSGEKAEIVRKILTVIQEFQSMGYRMTLRQLHYQLVTRNWIINHDSAYKKLGNILDDCRYAGMVDWEAIEDRGRVPYIPYSLDGVDDALRDAVDTYRRDRQEGQSNVVEVWSEKDALSGILRQSTSLYHVRLIINKGYGSSTAMYDAYQRAAAAIKEGKQFTILYFGDHDPSGLDMVRDIHERIQKFLCYGKELMTCPLLETWWEKNLYNTEDLWDYQFNDNVDIWGDEATDKGRDEWFAARVNMFLQEHQAFKVVHIGLTMEQIKEYNPPPNPTKMTDSRSDAYVKKFGRTCWEVDALRPDVLTAIVRENIQQQIDVDKFNKMIRQEEKDRKELKKLMQR